MGGYNDRMLMNSYKKYSKDETVAKLVSVLRSLKREIGVLTSERDEALYKLNGKKEFESYEGRYRKHKRLYDTQVILNNRLVDDNKKLKQNNKILVQENKELKESLNDLLNEKYD